MLLLVVVAGIGLRIWYDRGRIAPREETVRGLARIGDGDSLELAGRRYRLVGIDAPEYDQTCVLVGDRHPCGREAREHLVGLIAGRAVVCDWSKLDRYGRRLGRCRAGDTDLGAAMVRDGWAVAHGGYEREEADARAHRRGLWSGDFERPEDFRREKRGPAASRGWLDDWWPWGR